MSTSNTTRHHCRTAVRVRMARAAPGLRRRFRALALLGLCLGASAVAADAFEDGVAAAQRGDYAAAAQLWRPLATAGDARAQGALAMLHDKGEGVTRDYAEAFKLYRAAAEQGLPQAEYGLAVMYEDGRGTERDLTEAVKWYRRAANQRLAPAQYSLGLLYARGEGIARDYVQAHLWLSLAVRGLNDEQARATVERMRALVASKMSAQELAGAEQRVLSWSPSAPEE